MTTVNRYLGPAEAGRLPGERLRGNGVHQHGTDGSLRDADPCRIGNPLPGNIEEERGQKGMTYTFANYDFQMSVEDLRIIRKPLARGGYATGWRTSINSSIRT
jgi:hypothetical protein